MLSVLRDEFEVRLLDDDDRGEFELKLELLERDDALLVEELLEVWLGLERDCEDSEDAVDDVESVERLL